MYLLDQDTALTPDGTDQYRLTVSPNWNITAPNGGYVMAIAARALVTGSEFSDVISLSASFHKPTGTIESVVQVRELSRTKRMRTAQISLLQGEQLVSTFIGTATLPGAMRGRTEHRGIAPEWDGSHAVDPDILPLPFQKAVRITLPQSQFGWTAGETGQEMKFHGHFQFADHRPLDRLALVLLCDATPPPALRLTGPLGWVPTLDMNVQIRATPTGTRCNFESRTRFISDGLCETDIDLWSEDGVLLAIGRQLALLRES